MRFGLVAVLFAAACSSGGASAGSTCGFGQSASCEPGLDVDKQERIAMRFRCPAKGAPAPVTVADMLSWPAPPHVGTAAERQRDQPFEQRESEAFVLEADVWHMRFEASDCDLHVEVGAVGASQTSPRILLEIPNGTQFEPARKALFDAAGHVLQPNERFDFATPLHAKITGFAYYDSFYWTAADPRKGSGHGSEYVGTLWELHPVWAVEVVP